MKSRYFDKTHFIDRFYCHNWSALISSSIEKKIHESLINGNRNIGICPQDYKKWIEKLLKYNLEYNFFDNNILHSFLFELYRNIHNHKILIVYPEYASKINPFVKILTDELEKDYIIDVNPEIFWDKKGNYDVIHFHWPEAIFYKPIANEEKIKKLKNVIHYWKSKKSTIIYTRHNTQPHSTIDRNFNTKLYDIIEKNSNYIIHLGHWSKKEFIAHKPIQTNHIVIPHHLYEEYLSPWITRERARDFLQIPKDRLVILTFGDFRNDEERKWTLNAFDTIDNKKKLLLAPRFGGAPSVKYSKNKAYRLDNEFIDEEKVPYYFIASDIVFIQRLKILNSGNVPLAFLFNKKVVGPNVGNVGEILQKTHNFSFIPGDQTSVQKAFKAAINTKECHNYKYAIKNWGIKRITNQYRKLYNQLFENNS